MTRSIPIAPVRKSVVVDSDARHAFEVFTAGIDRWWPRSHGIGKAPLRESVIEPYVGGRWFTRHEDGSEAVVGHVRTWQPGECLVISWEIGADWKPDGRAELASEVEVRFITESATRTRVELEHRLFERMGAAPGETMRAAVDGGWPGLLQLYAAEVSGVRSRSAT